MFEKILSLLNPFGPTKESDFTVGPGPSPSSLLSTSGSLTLPSPVGQSGQILTCTGSTGAPTLTLPSSVLHSGGTYTIGVAVTSVSTSGGSGAGNLLTVTTGAGGGGGGMGNLGWSTTQIAPIVPSVALNHWQSNWSNALSPGNIFYNTYQAIFQSMKQTTFGYIETEEVDALRNSSKELENKVLVEFLWYKVTVKQLTNLLNSIEDSGIGISWWALNSNSSHDIEPEKVVANNLLNSNVFAGGFSLPIANTVFNGTFKVSAGFIIILEKDTDKELIKLIFKDKADGVLFFNSDDLINEIK